MATQTRNPTGDEAVAGTWTGTAGSRYTLVDDHPDSAGADSLVHGTTAGNLTFTFSAFTVPAGATVNEVRVHYYDRKDASQACNIGGRLKVSSSYFNATTHNPTNGSWVLRTDTWTTNPNTSAPWTVSEVNAIQAFGWVSTDASPTPKLASIQLEVDYTEATPVIATLTENAAAATDGVTGDVLVKGSLAENAATATDAITGSTSTGVSATLTETVSVATDAITGTVPFITAILSEMAAVATDSLFGDILVKATVAEQVNQATDSITNLSSTTAQLAEFVSPAIDYVTGYNYLLPWHNIRGDIHAICKEID